MLWNVIDNGILEPFVLGEINIVGFTDDSETARKVRTWLEKAGLTLANEKAKAVLKKKNSAKVEVGGHMVASKPTVKYLGVINPKLNLRRHLKYAYQKAAGATVVLARMLPNVGVKNHWRRLCREGSILFTD